MHGKEHKKETSIKPCNEQEQIVPLKRIKLEFELALPVEASDAEIAEWIKYELVGGSMNGSNPLANHYVVADYETLIFKAV